MHARTTGAIALRPTGNSQGGYYFYSLTTGRRLNRNNWTVLPMPNEVIDRILTLARRSRNDNGLTFLDRDGNAFLDEQTDDSDDEDEYFPDETDDYADNELFSDDESDASIPGVPLAPNINIAGVTEDNNVGNNIENDADEDSTDNEGFDGSDVDENPENLVTNADVEVPNNANADNDVDADSDVDENPDDMVQIDDESDGRIGDDEGE
eukprot:scaffold69305_cov32-Attheya_sp.AAC.1